VLGQQRGVLEQPVHVHGGALGAEALEGVGRLALAVRARRAEHADEVARRDLDAMASLVAERLTIGELVRRIDAIDRLASSLERNVNEALALEAGFLEIFCRKS